MSRAPLPLAIALLLLAAPAAAQPGPAPQPAPGPVVQSVPGAVQPAAPPMAAPPMAAPAPVAPPAAPQPMVERHDAVPSDDYVEKVNRHAVGLGLSYDNGLWGTGFGQGIRVDIPFGRWFGLRFRGVVAYGAAGSPIFDPALLGGAELFGRGPVVLGLVRLYGGGGIYVGGRPAAKTEVNPGVGGGGHMGAEFFMNPGFSFSIEVGGQGGVHAKGLDGGPSVMGGMTWYLFGG